MNDDIVEIRKSNVKFLWLIAERWFRVLEYSFIVGALHYLGDKTGNIFIKIFYWISLILLCMFFEEMGELIAEKIYSRKIIGRKMKSFIWIISMSVAVSFFIVIKETANILNK